MPIYEYQANDAAAGCEHCRRGFEVRQAMADPPLKTCPKCDGPVRRIISRTSVGTTPSTKSVLSDKNIKKHGFTKLVNEGEGKFRKI